VPTLEQLLSANAPMLLQIGMAALGVAIPGAATLTTLSTLVTNLAPFIEQELGTGGIAAMSLTDLAQAQAHLASTNSQLSALIQAKIAAQTAVSAPVAAVAAPVASVVVEAQASAPVVVAAPVAPSAAVMAPAGIQGTPVT
jgi:hypothetical protein